MFFKLLVFCAIFVGSSKCDDRRAVAFVPEVAENILKSIKQCTEEYSIDEGTLEVVRQGGYRADDTFKKFVYCSYFKSGYADKDGKVYVTKVIDAFPKDAHVDDVTKKCSESKGTDAVDTIYQFFKCFELYSPVRMSLT